MSALPENETRNAEVLALLDGGLSQLQAARHLGVTKNVVVGIWARAKRNLPMRYVTHQITTIERLDALHARMDAVMAETRGVGKLRNVPKRNTNPVYRIRPRT